MAPGAQLGDTPLIQASLDPCCSCAGPAAEPMSMPIELPHKPI